MATITGTAGNDTLVGTAEDDFLLLGPGSDSVDGGAGRDVLQLAPGAVETLGLGPGPHVYNVEPGRITDASGTINTVFTNVETVLLADQSGADVIVNHQPTGVTVQVQVSRGNFTINGSAAGGGEIVIVDVVGGAPLIASASDRNTLKLTQSGRTDVTARQIESVLIESSDSNSGVLFDSTIISSVRPRFFFVGTDRTDIINGGAESATILVRGSADDADRLRGGGGSTIYTIRSLTQVGMNGQILDFSVSDQINLADNFSTGVLPRFIGTSDFSGVAGQVRYAFVDATTVLLADTDGDRVADQRLTLANGRFYLDQFATNQLRTFFTPALIGTDGADSLVGTDSADILLGLGDNDTLRGGAGNDTLDGGSGVDHMFDTEGVNTFLVDNPADLVSGGGYAIVIASVDYTIRSLVAELRAAPGTAPINLTGTQDFQLVVGNDGDNILNGLSVGTLPGQALSTGDTLIGLGGNDTFAVQNSFTIVTEATGGGIDTIFASVDYTLQAGSEIEVLSAANQTGTEPLRFTGNEFAQTIVGNFGANALRGGGGADTLIGLRGDDSYTVDTTGTVIREAAGEGFDTLVVTAGAANFLLNGGASVEMLRAEAGSAPINIGGNEFSQRIEGNDGANILSSGGGGGVDTMVGGLGDDVYRVFATGDVIEDMGGFDTVFASGTSYFLYSTAEVEYLSASEQAGTTPIYLVGNGASQVIAGNFGDNIINGRGGDGQALPDTLIGLAGNDTYGVFSEGDVVREVAGQGQDVVYASTSYQLRAGTEIEALAAINGQATDGYTLRGNEVAQTVVGNAGANVLDGRGGNDTLVGLAGADTFAFTAALGAGNVDTIQDFAAEDRIGLASDVFAAVTSGGVEAGEFVLGTTAQDADDRLLYDQATGRLFYDADANGAGTAVLFAQLSPGTALTAASFVAVAPVSDLPGA